MFTKKKILLSTILTLCLGAILALSACAVPSGESVDEQEANKEYMSQVNIIMDDLSADLEGFTEAVAQSDVVGMQSKSESAYREIDKLEKLEAPEGLKDIHEEYVQGCKDLKDALGSYVELYSDISNATEEQPFDFDTYDDRLKKIKDKYQDGIDHLEDADKLATEAE